jgi:hypothetical protein
MAEFDESNVPRHFVAITPSDSVEVDLVGIYVGVAGNIALLGRGDPPGGQVTLTNVPAGTTIQASIRRVYATGTTATGLVGQR